MFSFDRREKDRESGKEPALMKGAGVGTIEKIQNKNGGSPAESIRGSAAIIFLSAAQSVRQAHASFLRRKMILSGSSQAGSRKYPCAVR